MSTKDRTEFLSRDFRELEAYLLKQLKMERFDPFGQQSADQMRIIGMIVDVPAIGERSTVLKEGAIGMLDLSDSNNTGMFRLKLNVSEVTNYALLEGAVVVAEGFMSNLKFNVNRIHAPALRPPPSMMQSALTRHNVDNAKQKPM